MKKCGRCVILKADDEFGRNRSLKDGLSCWCKDCVDDYRRGRKFEASRIKWYSEHPNHSWKWNREHRDHNRSLRFDLKVEVFHHYSPEGKCQENGCSVSDIRCLTVEHVNRVKPNGAPRGGLPLYKWLKDHNYPSGFMILCMNHNYKKIGRKKNVSQSTESHRKLRYEVYSAYSPPGIPECRKCGERDVDVLCLDHVHGGGKQDWLRRGNGNAGNGSTTLMHNLRKNGYPSKDKYQVLCQNHNMIKKCENGEYGKRYVKK